MTLATLGIVSLILTASPTADDLLRDAAGVIDGFKPLFHTKTRHDPDRIVFGFKTASSDAVEITLTPRGAQEGAVVQAGSYDAQVVVRSDTKDAADDVKRAISVILNRITERAELGPRLLATRVTQRSEQSRGPPNTAEKLPSAHKRIESAEQTGTLELWLCLLLVALSLLILPWTLKESWLSLAHNAPAWRKFNGHIWLGLISFLVVWVGVFEIPRQLVTVFAGYGTVVEAWALRPVVKYGAATTAFYGPFLNVFGPSTDVVIALNLAVGLMTPLFGAVLARRLSGSWYGGAFGLLLIGLLAALMRDRASESILVPWSFWALATLVHLEGLIRTNRTMDRLGVLIFGALTLHGRPEAWIVLPLLSLAILRLPHSTQAGAWRTTLWPLVGVIALAAPRLWSLVHYAFDASQTGDVPGLAEVSSEAMIERFLNLNALWTPEVFPVTAGLAALGALWWCGVGNRTSVVLLIMTTLVWQLLSTLDLPPVSMPRTQAPAMMWTAILAATCLGRLAEQSTRIRLAAWAGLLVLLIPTPATLASLWQPTNPQRFDAFWDRMMETVEDDGRDRCVVALDMSDPPSDSVIRLYPFYELAERSGRLEVFSITTFVELPARVLDGHCDPLYIEGPQCRARFFGFDAAAPPVAEELPLCRRMQTEFHLLPLMVDDVDNAGNADFPFYGQSPTLRYGLYRIGGLARHPPQVPGADVR